MKEIFEPDLFSLLIGGVIYAALRWFLPNNYLYLSILLAIIAASYSTVNIYHLSELDSLWVIGEVFGAARLLLVIIALELLFILIQNYKGRPQAQDILSKHPKEGIYSSLLNKTLLSDNINININLYIVFIIIIIISIVFLLL